MKRRGCGGGRACVFPVEVGRRLQWRGPPGVREVTGRGWSRAYQGDHCYGAQAHQPGRQADGGQLMVIIVIFSVLVLIMSRVIEVELHCVVTMEVIIVVIIDMTSLIIRQKIFQPGCE